jgi:hypothetical protein
MRLRFPGPGLFVALLALTCQLALGASAPGTANGTADPRAPSGIICHVGDPGTVPSAPLHRGPTCQLCPLCIALSTPAPPLLSGASVPPRATAHLMRAGPPLRAATAPAINLLSARPRGPPPEA